MKKNEILATIDSGNFNSLIVKDLSKSLRHGDSVLHQVIASADKGKMVALLKRIGELELTQTQLKGLFQKHNALGYNPIDQLLDADNPNESLNTFLEAVNDTGNKELLKAVYDAKGWAADGQEGPTLVQSIEAMDDKSLKTDLQETVKNSLRSFAYKHGNYLSKLGEKEIIGHSKETKTAFEILDKNFPDEAEEIKEEVETGLLFKSDLPPLLIVAFAATKYFSKEGNSIEEQDKDDNIQTYFQNEIQKNSDSHSSLDNLVEPLDNQHLEETKVEQDKVNTFQDPEQSQKQKQKEEEEKEVQKGQSTEDKIENILTYFQNTERGEKDDNSKYDELIVLLKELKKNSDSQNTSIQFKFKALLEQYNKSESMSSQQNQYQINPFHKKNNQLVKIQKTIFHIYNQPGYEKEEDNKKKDFKTLVLQGAFQKNITLDNLYITKDAEKLKKYEKLSIIVDESDDNNRSYKIGYWKSEDNQIAQQELQTYKLTNIDIEPYKHVLEKLMFIEYSIKYDYATYAIDSKTDILKTKLINWAYRILLKKQLVQENNKDQEMGKLQWSILDQTEFYSDREILELIKEAKTQEGKEQIIKGYISPQLLIDLNKLSDDKIKKVYLFSSYDEDLHYNDRNPELIKEVAKILAPDVEIIIEVEKTKLAIADFSPPSQDQLTKAYNALKGDIQANNNIAIICGASKGRVGTVLTLLTYEQNEYLTMSDAMRSVNYKAFNEFNESIAIEKGAQKQALYQYELDKLRNEDKITDEQKDILAEGLILEKLNIESRKIKDKHSLYEKADLSPADLLNSLGANVSSCNDLFEKLRMDDATEEEIFKDWLRNNANDLEYFIKQKLNWQPNNEIKWCYQNLKVVANNPNILNSVLFRLDNSQLKKDILALAEQEFEINRLHELEYNISKQIFQNLPTQQPAVFIKGNKDILSEVFERLPKHLAVNRVCNRKTKAFDYKLKEPKIYEREFIKILYINKILDKDEILKTFYPKIKEEKQVELVNNKIFSGYAVISGLPETNGGLKFADGEQIMNNNAVKHVIMAKDYKETQDLVILDSLVNGLQKLHEVTCFNHAMDAHKLLNGQGQVLLETIDAKTLHAVYEISVINFKEQMVQISLNSQFMDHKFLHFGSAITSNQPALALPAQISSRVESGQANNSVVSLISQFPSSSSQEQASAGNFGWVGWFAESFGQLVNGINISLAAFNLKTSVDVLQNDPSQYDWMKAIADAAKFQIAYCGSIFGSQSYQKVELLENLANSALALKDGNLPYALESAETAGKNFSEHITFKLFAASAMVAAVKLGMVTSIPYVLPTLMVGKFGYSWLTKDDALANNEFYQQYQQELKNGGITTEDYLKIKGYLPLFTYNETDDDIMYQKQGWQINDCNNNFINQTEAYSQCVNSFYVEMINKLEFDA